MWHDSCFVGNGHVLQKNSSFQIYFKNTIPMTPHGVFRFVDGSDYCWVFYPYDSEEDEEGPIMEFAEHLADYFYERCGVGKW